MSSAEASGSPIASQSCDDHLWQSSALLGLTDLTLQSPRRDPSSSALCDEKRKPELTLSSHHRPLWPHTLQPLNRSLDSNHSAAISAYPYSISSRQDVRPVNTSAASFTSPSTVSRNNCKPSLTPLGQSNGLQHHVSLNSHLPSSGTLSHTYLASHYDLPQKLPPVPCTTPHHSHPVTAPPPAPAASDELLNFSLLKNNYLNMLSQNPTDNTTAADTASPIMHLPASPAASRFPVELNEINAAIQTMLASPEFQSAGDSFDNQFLTSPLLSTPFDTPFDDFATSPLQDSPFSEFLPTPLTQDSPDFGDAVLTSPSQYPNLPLFGGTDSAYTYDSKAAEVSTSTLPLDTSNLYTMPPMSPSLDTLDAPSSKPLYSFPRVPTTSAIAATAPHHCSALTGTRKNVTPFSLVPLDAPTQPRRYVLPSSTSRKEIPAAFAKKRSRRVAFGDEEDELDEAPGPSASEKEQIEWKRRQNTLAARKSRKRKLEYLQLLESEVDRLKTEKEQWKTRAEMLKGVIRNNGIPLNDFEETTTTET